METCEAISKDDCENHDYAKHIWKVESMVRSLDLKKASDFNKDVTVPKW